MKPTACKNIKTWLLHVLYVMLQKQTEANVWKQHTSLICYLSKSFQLRRANIYIFIMYMYFHVHICLGTSLWNISTHSTSSTFTRQLNKWNHGLKSQITYKTRKFSKHTFLEPSSLSLFCLRKLISNILHNWMYREWLCARGRERGALAGRGIRAGTRVRGSQLARQSMQKLWLVSIGGMNMPYECECSVSGLWVCCGYS